MYAFRGLGAGDVKLMVAIGALKGPEFFLFTFAWAAVFGGAMAVAGLLRSRKMTVALAHLYFFRFFPRPDGSFITAGRMPYAPAIALGAMLALGGARWIQF
jgi:prepilin peptidase CpaA